MKLVNKAGISQTDAQNFCALFDENMGLLYSLALVLTGDDTAAEHCLLSALEDCLKGPDVAPEWARSWSRRAVVKQAIRLVRPNPAAADSAFAEREERDAKQIADVRGRITQMPPFERFVFVMAVLERYSIQECALLLDCAAREVARARIRALQLIAGVGASAPGSVIASSSAVSAQIAR